MEYPQYVTHIQSILSSFMPGESELTREKADELGSHLLALDVVNPNERKRGHHQTVAVYREQGTWSPVTIHWQTDDAGRIRYVRIHAPKFVKEYGEE